MSISYLFGKEEIKCLLKLLNADSETVWTEREKKLLLKMEKKGYFFLKAGIIYLEPVLKLFLEIIQNSDKKIKFDDGELYQKNGIYLWVYPDRRKLDGIAVRPYRTLNEWYKREKEFI